jgi:hypothetical protein
MTGCFPEPRKTITAVLLKLILLPSSSLQTYQARPAKGKSALATGKGAPNAETHESMGKVGNQPSTGEPEANQPVREVVDLTGDNDDEAAVPLAQPALDQGIKVLLDNQQGVVVREVRDAYNIGASW